MKPLLKLTFAFLLALTLSSCKKENLANTKSLIQNNASTPVRYRDSVFASVDTTTYFNVFYRRVQNFDGMVDLKMDAYLPLGDTVSRRAAVIYIHGGGFGAGSRKDADIKRICTDYAKRGYVAITISYRLGVNFIYGQTRTQSEQKYYDAVYRAAQDARAALRFIKMHGQSAKIDTNKIFIGGGSAGAGTAINTAYLDQAELVGTDFSQWGPLDGKGIYDYPTYGLRVKGVINLAGAIIHKTYINNGDEPMISFYGTEDIYYKDDVLNYRQGYLPIAFDNGKKIKLYMDNLGIKSDTTLYVGRDHAGYDANIIKNFLNVSSNWMYNLMQ